MSESSPADLSVAFRSVERRLREALEPVGGDETVASASIGRIRMRYTRAGELLGVSATPAAIADELARRPAEAWDESILDAIRQIALDIGKLIREVAAEAEREAG